MAKSGQVPTVVLRSALRFAAGAAALFCVLATMDTGSAQAQTYTVLHSFSGGAAGANPSAGLTKDAAGNFYGTTAFGGNAGGNCGQSGCGTVFKLTQHNGAWVLTTLYRFQGGLDGATPAARVVFGPDGALYGTTQQDVTGGGCNLLPCGTVFSLRPPATVCRAVSCPWSETVLYHFTGGADGGFPGYGDLIFDNAGNIYGTTELGGPLGLGTVYKLTHSNGGWTESVVYNFGGLDGAYPFGGMLFDRAGNLYGTTAQGGSAYHPPQFNGNGTIFELSPQGSGWVLSAIYCFQANDGELPYGELPYAALTSDVFGNLFGAASMGGGGDCTDGNQLYGGCGTLFSFSGGFAESLYAFPSFHQITSAPGPQAPITIDSAGSIYGTTNQDGANLFGSVFKFAAGTYTSLHDFAGGADGAYPVSNVLIDAAGNLYGTASVGGSHGNGAVWEITP